MHDPVPVLGVLAACIALSEWLARRTVLSHLGTALLVIVLTAVAANAGVIPTYSDEIPLYRGVFAAVAPLGIFYLLLGVRLRDVLAAGRPMILLFLAGSAGTFGGVLVGMRLIDGEHALGELQHAIGGMFCATYTGGSVNFNAIALHYRVADEGVLYAGAAAVDNVMTTVWMAVTLLVPRVLRRWWPAPVRGRGSAAGAAPGDGIAEDTESVHPAGLAALLALGAACLWLSEALAARWGLPSILLLTTLALLLAQLPALRRLRGARLLGMLAVYLFLAVIGALCDVAALGSLGDVGLALLLLVAVVVAVHGLVTFGCAALLRLDLDIAAVASQANVGGGTSALALARGLGRGDLVLPGILVGALGNALGTYLGFLCAELLARG